MKVSELIEELQQLPQDLEVTIWHHSNGYGPRDRAPRPKVRPSHLTLLPQHRAVGWSLRTSRTGR